MYDTLFLCFLSDICFDLTERVDLQWILVHVLEHCIANIYFSCILAIRKMFYSNVLFKKFHSKCYVREEIAGSGKGDKQHENVFAN